MTHSQKQLNQFWAAIQSGQQAEKADAVRPMAAPGSYDILPEILCSDKEAQVMSVPIEGSPDRAIYARKPGGSWVELP
jgi:hypothetical protein